MVHSLLDILRSVASDFAARDADHFVLDQLDRYPGSLPFSLSSPTNSTEEFTSPSDEETVETPIRLDPALVAEITAEVERSHKQRATAKEDPLARLEEQLALEEPLYGSPGDVDDDRMNLYEDSREDTGKLPSTPVDNLEEQAIEEVNVPPSTSVSHWSTRKRPLLVALGGLVVITGILLMLHLLMTRKLPDTAIGHTNSHEQLPKPDTALEGSKQAHQPTPVLRGDTTIHTPSPTVLAQTPTAESVSTVPRVVEKPKEMHPPKRDEISLPIKQPTLHTHEQDITIVVPPSLPPPKRDATFVIQLCSTPSYAEALRWKRFAEERLHGEQVTITERSIREQTYYRVRVGAYRSQTDAQQAVRALGLSLADVWIVQIQ